MHFIGINWFLRQEILVAAKVCVSVITMKPLELYATQNKGSHIWLGGVYNSLTDEIRWFYANNSINANDLSNSTFVENKAKHKCLSLI